ncbi:hypothetical protein SDC9_77358 [bioreactor metagenome]|uniref:Uncharacterized protein n=1 Tax=bioreactor metagenome TaxID=1076179 RepID=A0A644YS53_9ZZZZ
MQPTHFEKTENSTFDLWNTTSGRKRLISNQKMEKSSRQKQYAEPKYCNYPVAGSHISVDGATLSFNKVERIPEKTNDNAREQPDNDTFTEEPETKIVPII